jgi:hypothetical protein
MQPGAEQFPPDAGASEYISMCPQGLVDLSRPALCQEVCALNTKSSAAMILQEFTDRAASKHHHWTVRGRGAGLPAAQLSGPARGGDRGQVRDIHRPRYWFADGSFLHRASRPAGLEKLLRKARGDVWAA